MRRACSAASARVIIRRAKHSASAAEIARRAEQWLAEQGIFQVCDQPLFCARRMKPTKAEIKKLEQLAEETAKVRQALEARGIGDTWVIKLKDAERSLRAIPEASAVGADFK